MPLVQEWDVLAEEHRDLLRHLANLLMPTTISTWIKMRGAWEFGRLALRVGPDEATKQVMDFAEARQVFLDAVLDAEERANAAFQGYVAESIRNALNETGRGVVAKGQVGEWFRRLPS